MVGIETMDNLNSRLIKYYIRQNYPVRVVDTGSSQYRVSLPDLPGCEVLGTDLDSLYGRLEILRQRWVREHILSGCPVPMPSTYLSEVTLPPKSVNQLTEERENLAP